MRKGRGHTRSSMRDCARLQPIRSIDISQPPFRAPSLAVRTTSKGLCGHSNTSILLYNSINQRVGREVRQS